MRNVGWRKHISREVSSSLPSYGIGLSDSKSASKLKLETKKSLAQNREIADGATLTPIGKTVQGTTTLAQRLSTMPRLFAHAGVVLVVAGIVLSGSTGHPSKLSPVADQSGYGSILDQAAAADVAAKVATQTALPVAQDVSSTAKTLNAQVSLPTADDGTLAANAVVDTTGSARGLITYNVKPGDTLGSVAAQFNITTDTVRWANNLSSDELKPGQPLLILPISGLQYKVAPGDTAQSLADKYQSNADQIIAFNNAETHGLQPGQSIIIPDGVLPGSAPSADAPASLAQAQDDPGVVSSAPGSRANGYAFGYCTWYVATRRAIPNNWGNANSWYSNAQISGFRVGSRPAVGAIAWSGAGYYGHVAYVESVSGGNVTVSEMNWNGNWDRKTFRTVSASTFRYIY